MPRTTTAPLGVELKRNVKEHWWQSMVYQNSDIEGIDAAILMHPEDLGGVRAHGGVQ